MIIAESDRYLCDSVIIKGAIVRTPWNRLIFAHQSPPLPSLIQLSRRRAISGGAAALSTTTTLAGCGVNPRGSVYTQALNANTELSTRLANASELSIGGEILNIALLRRFYARYDFRPVWTTRQAQADSLFGAVLRAGDQGLNPGMFHANLLQRGATLPPLDLELLLSDAFLSYGGALAHGAVPVKLRGPNETLTPGPIDLAAALDIAISSPDPGRAIEALAPTTLSYLTLRRAMKLDRAAATAGDKTAIRRVRKIEVNLERERWLPRPLPLERVWVNVANERLVFYRADEPVFFTRVVVGQDVERNQSPEFCATIKSSFFNPPWVIPKDIVEREILPDILHDPNYLKKNDMIMLADGDAEQLPGPDAGLGLIMFDMPNRFDVYLHDTPDRDIFNLADRRISHGCIRVQHPRELASLLLQQPIGVINREIEQGHTTEHYLPVPVPVFVVYQTVFLDTSGRLQFRPDFYKRDAEIWRQLQRNSQW